tara:strand:- start:16961 stop:17179 length:219 start_codon:yes stop_codon:yes gene_type:complete
MKCWHCDSELIWDNDQDMTEDLLEENVVYDMVTNLHCASCGALVEVYHKKQPKVKLIEVEPAEEYTHDSEGC